jgi:hypothetical protein
MATDGRRRRKGCQTEAHSRGVAATWSSSGLESDYESSNAKIMATTVQTSFTPKTGSRPNLKALPQWVGAPDDSLIGPLARAAHVAVTPCSRQVGY